MKTFTVPVVHISCSDTRMSHHKLGLTGNRLQDRWKVLKLCVCVCVCGGGAVIIEGHLKVKL